MSDSQTMLTDAANRLFADLAADQNLDFGLLWRQLDEAGFPSLLVGEAGGGFGGDWSDAVAVLRLAGYHALPAPLAEAMIAARLLHGAGLTPADGITSLAASCEGRLDGSHFTGQLTSVAWGRIATTIVAVLDGRVLRVRREAAREIHLSHNPMGEPRDTLCFDNAAVGGGETTADPFALGALARTAMIAGALDAALARSVAYANERVQFGKPIGKFQAVQQNLAVFAEEAAAVNCAAQAAARAVDRGDAGFEIAAAKLRANMAAGVGHATAHQIHGAIGFTFEYDLHRWTGRLVSWASEFGSERTWAERLGGHVAARGPDELWSDIASRSDADFAGNNTNNVAKVP
jgi:acyl-CoA dehydrogenase